MNSSNPLSLLRLSMRQMLGAVFIASCLVFSLRLSAEQIKLSSGEILTVEIRSITNDTIRFVHPVLGEMTLPRTAVTILPPPAPGEKAAPPAAAAPAAEKAEPKPTSPPPPAGSPAPPPVAAPVAPKEWKFKLVIAAGLTQGNTENGNFTGLFSALREVPDMKTAFDTGYFFAQSNGDRSENRFTVGGRNDWLNPGSKWFYFADLRYDMDEFQSWDSRINGHVGIGYHLISPPKFALNLLAGIGAVKEFGSDNDDIRPEALAGIEGKYDFAEKHSLAFSSTIYPDLKDIGEYRWVNTVAWNFLIDTEDKLSLTAGMQHEYQSNVDPGRKYNDFRFFAGVQFEF